MKIINQHSGNYAEIDRLIDRYYEGLTSGEEEKLLRNLLSRKDLPERYKTERAIFGYFETKKQKQVFRLQPYFRWGAAVAAVAILVIGLGIQRSKLQDLSDYAFVNGVKITDKHMIKCVAENSMKEISGGTKDKSPKLDAKEIMTQQLGAFSE